MKNAVQAPPTNRDIARGANVVKGKVTCKAVADTFGLAYTPVETLL